MANNRQFITKIKFKITAFRKQFVPTSGCDMYFKLNVIDHTLLHIFYKTIIICIEFLIDA